MHLAAIDYEGSRGGLLIALKLLRSDLERIYSEEWFRLSDIEEDAKHGAIGRLQKCLFEKLGPFMDAHKIDPGVHIIPKWFIDMLAVINTRTASRTAFQIMDQLIPILEAADMTLVAPMTV
jgi:hypothetical protein